MSEGSEKLNNGSLVPSDIGVSIHSVLKTCAESAGLWVATLPINLQLAGGPDDDANDGVALLLHMDSFSFEQLTSWRKFTSKGLRHVLDLHGLSERPLALPTMDEQAEVVEGILGIRDDAGVAARTKFEGGAAAFAEWLQVQGLVSQPPGQKMCFSPEAQILVRTAWDLILDQEPCLCVRSIPFSDMTRYELMEVLDANGWTCKHCRKKKEVKDLVAEPYRVNVSTNKFYFVQAKGTENCLKQLLRDYLLCLASAEIHQRPVPHFKTAETYRKIMDPAYVAKLRRRRVREIPVGEDDWDIPPAVGREAQKRGAAKRAPRRPSRSG